MNKQTLSVTQQRLLDMEATVMDTSLTVGVELTPSMAFSQLQIIQ